MASAATARQLGTVLANAAIHRLAGDRDPAPAMAIHEGRIIAIGSLDAARRAAPDARVVDLQGKTVLPSFVDSHTHFHRAAVLRELYLDFETLAPADVGEVLALVGQRAAASAPGAWIQGDSISPARLAEQRLPDRWQLDSVSGDHPVVIRGIGKHVVVANSRALELAGIDGETDDPPGGRIERDASGRPTGILHERAKLRLDTSAADSVVPRADPDERMRALKNGIAALHRLGISTIHEMARLPEEAGDFARLHAAGELGIRVRLYYRVHEAPFSLDWLTSLGLRSGWGDERLRVAGVKVSIDGWCIFRNAAVYEPYLDEPENTGLLRIEPAGLDDIVARADAAGLQVAVHAVGARAVDAALHAFAAIGPPRSGPHRLEHAYLDVDPERLKRIHELGLVLSTQPSFLAAYLPDWRTGLSEARIDRIMPLASAHALGIRVIINSDTPSGPIGPLQTIRAAVTRDAGTQTIGDGEGLTLADAWRAHTSTPALATGDAAIGALEVGRRADLVVLAEDPFVEGAAIPESVAATMVDGEVVYDPEGTMT